MRLVLLLTQLAKREPPRLAHAHDDTIRSPQKPQVRVPVVLARHGTLGVQVQQRAVEELAGFGFDEVSKFSDCRREGSRRHHLAAVREPADAILRHPARLAPLVHALSVARDEFLSLERDLLRQRLHREGAQFVVHGFNFFVSAHRARLYARN